MYDPRKGHPSASAFGRYALCRASFALAQQCPITTSPEAESGTRIHRRLAGEEVALDDREQAIYERCLALESELLEAFALLDRGTKRREIRLWYKDLFSGQADLIVEHEDVALICDYKTGSEPVELAKSNWQLRALAALLCYEREHRMAEPVSTSKIITAIIQPEGDPGINQCVYDLDDIRAISLDCVVIAEECMLMSKGLMPLTPVPGESQCKYCPATTICPTHQRWALGPVQATLREDSSREDIDQFVGQLPAESCAYIFRRIAYAERLFASVKERLRHLSDDELAKVGLCRKPGRKVQIITDPITVGKRLATLGWTPADFFGCCQVQKSKLLDAIRRVHGCSAKEAEMIYRSATDGCTTTREDTPIITTIKSLPSVEESHGENVAND